MLNYLCGRLVGSLSLCVVAIVAIVFLLFTSSLPLFLFVCWTCSSIAKIIISIHSPLTHHHFSHLLFLCLCYWSFSWILLLVYRVHLISLPSSEREKKCIFILMPFLSAEFGLQVTIVMYYDQLQQLSYEKPPKESISFSLYLTERIVMINVYDKYSSKWSQQTVVCQGDTEIFKYNIFSPRLHAGIQRQKKGKKKTTSRGSNLFLA